MSVSSKDPISMTEMLMAALMISRATKIINAVRIKELQVCKIVWVRSETIGNLSHVQESRVKTQAQLRT